MITEKHKVVVLCSGGMDSVAALYEAARDFEITAVLSFHYGSKHNDREIPFAEFHAQKLDVPHSIIRLDFIGEQFKSDLLKKGGEIPKGHYEEQTMKQKDCW
jgi:7-cyano-7-deazaguanine synthase